VKADGGTTAVNGKERVKTLVKRAWNEKLGWCIVKITRMVQWLFNGETCHAAVGADDFYRLS